MTPAATMKFRNFEGENPAPLKRRTHETNASETFNTEIAGERQLRIAYPPSMVNSGQVFSAITDAGLGIVDVSTRETDLEEVFLKLTQAPEDAA